MLTDPRGVDADLDVVMPDTFLYNDNLIIPPAPEEEADAVEVVPRPPTSSPFPKAEALAESLSGKVLLKMEGQHHHRPYHALGQLAPAPSAATFPSSASTASRPWTPTFPERAKAEGGGFLLAGQNYGQGSSPRAWRRLVPLYLKVRGVLAKSFARIHRANLINNGILPLEFADEADYDRFEQGDELALENVAELVRKGASRIPVTNVTKGFTAEMKLELTERQRGMILAGGPHQYDFPAESVKKGAASG